MARTVPIRPEGEPWPFTSLSQESNPGLLRLRQAFHTLRPIGISRAGITHFVVYEPSRRQRRVFNFVRMVLAGCCLEAQEGTSTHLVARQRCKGVPMNRCTEDAFGAS